MTALGLVLAAAATALITFASTMPLARWLTSRGLVDVPNHRSMHTGTVPRGGGAGVIVAVVLVTVVGAAAGVDARAVVALSFALLLGGVGFVDDRYNLPATPRIAAQLLVAVGALAMLRDPDLSSATEWSFALTAVVTMIWVLGCCNAVNFMDGIDGITGLHMVVFGTHLVIVGYDDVLVRFPSALLVGAAVGFLYWNAVRRRVFLGDGGAAFVGAYVALLVVLAAARTTVPLIAAAPLAVYAADTLTAFVPRVIRREQLTEGHRDHVYQRLVLAGRGHLPVACFTAVCSAMCSAAAVAVGDDLLPVSAGVAVVGATVAAYLTAPGWLPGPGSGPRSRRRAEGTTARAGRSPR